MKKNKFFTPIAGIILTFAIVLSFLVVFKGTDFILIKYYYFSGYSKQKSYDNQGAIKDYSKVLKLDDKFVTAYISRGSAYLDLKKYNDAISDYNKAIELNPIDPQAYAYRGRTYYEINQYEDALHDYDKAITFDSNFAYAYYNRGLIKYTIYMDFINGCADFKIASNLGSDDAIDIINSGKCE